jgi:hypothetical protein
LLPFNASRNNKALAQQQMLAQQQSTRTTTKRFNLKSRPMTSSKTFAISNECRPTAQPTSKARDALPGAKSQNMSIKLHSQQCTGLAFGRVFCAQVRAALWKVARRTRREVVRTELFAGEVMK